MIRWEGKHNSSDKNKPDGHNSMNMNLHIEYFLFSRHFIYFYLGQVAILLFKSG